MKRRPQCMSASTARRFFWLLWNTSMPAYISALWLPRRRRKRSSTRWRCLYRRSLKVATGTISKTRLLLVNLRLFVSRHNGSYLSCYCKQCSCRENIYHRKSRQALDFVFANINYTKTRKMFIAEFTARN